MNSHSLLQGIFLIQGSNLCLLQYGRRGLGRSPGEGNGSLLQYSGLENSMDCIAHWVTKSWTRLSDFHFHRSYCQPTMSSLVCQNYSTTSSTPISRPPTPTSLWASVSTQTMWLWRVWTACSGGWWRRGCRESLEDAKPARVVCPFPGWPKLSQDE